MNDSQRTSGSLTWLWVIIAIVILAGLIYWTHQHTENSGAAATGRGGTNTPPLMVSTATARQGDIGVYLTALGVVTPQSTVAVQSRVAGQILKVLYQEGQLVHEGDVLIEIDPGPYQAAVTQAEGQLARDSALLEDARLNLERYQEAFASNAIPRQQYETQLATVHQYEGTVKLDQGNLDNARVQLAYCHITAPVTGRAGLRLVDAGNTVQASGSNTLLIITQLQPISVLFNVAEDNLPQIQAPLRQGGELPVEVFDRTQLKLLATGKLTTLDNQIDTATGTLKIRALFPNDDEALFPNQFVNVRLLVATHEDVTLVPNTVIQRNADSAFVYLITQNPTNQEQIVAVHPVTLGTTDGTITEVGDLKPGSMVAADNFNRLVEGAKVTLRPAEGKGGKGGKKDQQSNLPETRSSKSEIRKKSEARRPNQRVCARIPPHFFRAAENPFRISGFTQNANDISGYNHPSPSIPPPIEGRGRPKVARLDGLEALAASATDLNTATVRAGIVARLQRLMAIGGQYPGRCPGLSCGGLSGLFCASPASKQNAPVLPLTGDGTARITPHRYRSAGFPACCIAGFPTGWAWVCAGRSKVRQRKTRAWHAGLEICDTADLEICATTNGQTNAPPNSLLMNPKKRRVRAHGLHHFRENHGFCRPGALTGRFFQQAANDRLGDTQKHSS